MSNISVVLVDDHPLVRNGLQRLLAGTGGYTIVGEAADGPTALELVARLQPAVLVLDLMLPGMSGLEVIRHVRQRSPTTGVVVLSLHIDGHYVREAINAGALGYVSKSAEAAELLQAVRAVAENRRYLAQHAPDSQIGTHVDDPYDLLSASEQAVLKLAALGYSSTAIAEQLALSARTVEAFYANLLHKLDLTTPADLGRYAISRGLTEPEPS
ncbi:MAG: response regulator transcription factor [Chloroflexaceae bacterium]|jgi:DNA-binding NarL/FixJ family response regulator|nr:response regulator transcription factor [Chloroflexaceae bacterium]